MNKMADRSAVRFLLWCFREDCRKHADKDKKSQDGIPPTRPVSGCSPKGRPRRYAAAVDSPQSAVQNERGNHELSPCVDTTLATSIPTCSTNARAATACGTTPTSCDEPRTPRIRNWPGSTSSSWSTRISACRRIVRQPVPPCGSAMVAVEYGKTKVRIDGCPACEGIWLDEGEFEPSCRRSRTRRRRWCCPIICGRRCMRLGR